MVNILDFELLNFTKLVKKSHCARVVCLRSFSKMGLLTFNAGRDEGGLNELTINESFQEIILIYLNMLVILN
jgi:hypothetical protein